MVLGDPERERQRLAQLYAGMSDGELLRVAEDPAALSAAALVAMEDDAAQAFRVLNQPPDLLPLEDTDR